MHRSSVWRVLSTVNYSLKATVINAKIMGKCLCMPEQYFKSSVIFTLPCLVEYLLIVVIISNDISCALKQAPYKEEIL